MSKGYRGKQYLESDLAFLRAENERKPVEPPSRLISDWVQDRRILPPSTPFPGFWENRRTPYCVEIMDNMAPHSPIQHTVAMKAGQLGLTAAAENVLAYWMDESPAEILFISNTADQLEKWATKRLEPLIDSCGIRPKIYAQTENKLSRRSGDKVFTKEFSGGALDMASAQSAASLRADSKRLLIRDEIDGAPLMLRTGEGDFLSVSYVRTNAWGNRRKVLDISTPTVMGDSAIQAAYELGDKRAYFVPCPHCEKMQVLTWQPRDSSYGIKAETKAGRLEKVYYLCEFCREAIFNHHKTDMLIAGEWRPTAVSQSAVYRSYQLSSLYSPVGMLSWFELYEEWTKAKERPEGLRAFKNLYEGLPYVEQGTRPEMTTLLELRGGYKMGTVPEGVLFQTMAVDVQGGTKRDNDPARLELEVCGHGAGYRTWLIDYRVIVGEITDPFGGAWEELRNWSKESGLIYEREDGKKFKPFIIFVDSGFNTDVVYRFCGAGWRACFPSKGFTSLKTKRSERDDPATATNFRRFRAARVGGDLTLYEISTNFYKGHLYNNLKIERVEGRDLQRPGFCDFPTDTPTTYFEMLRAEERRKDRVTGQFTFVCPAGRRNEALDLRVMNLCASDVFLEAEVFEMRQAAKEQGANTNQLQAITTKTVLHYLEKAARLKVKEK
jgi:phage terminase large subunit GpA-like protein